MRKIFLVVLSAIILNFSAVFAAEVWTLPEDGLKLEGAAKQNYIAEKMNAIFHPPEGTTPPKKIFEVPDGWNYEKFSLDGLPIESLENPTAETERVILQLHGGGYVLPLGNSYRILGVKQAVLADAAKIYYVDYRIAPKNIFPAALDDAVKIYKEILNRGTDSKNIIVIGDSAGGNLALELSLYLKENKLPQPKMLILISPWTTVETKFPSRRYNAEKDLVLGKGTKLFDAVKKNPYIKGYSKKDPRLSPIYADLKNLPPMLIQVGGYEIFLDECLELAKKAAADDVPATLTIYPAMPHDFAFMLPDLQDSLDSFREIRDFINLHS